jgi:hypothetical protein
MLAGRVLSFEQQHRGLMANESKSLPYVHDIRFDQRHLKVDANGAFANGVFLLHLLHSATTLGPR